MYALSIYPRALKKGNKIFHTKVGYHIKYGKEWAEKDDTERIYYFSLTERSKTQRTFSFETEDLFSFRGDQHTGGIF